MIIGITGLIGSGKSTAASFLKSKGAKIIDADKIGRSVVNNSQPLLNKLVKAFGKEILNNNKKLNRKKLAELAFANKTSTNKLNKLVHPYLLKEINRQLKKHKNSNQIVIDAALLLNWRLDKISDFVLMIHASKQSRYKRLANRKISKTDAQAREKAQLSYAQMKSKADKVIPNNKTKFDLLKKLSKWFNSLA